MMLNMVPRYTGKVVYFWKGSQASGSWVTSPGKASASTVIAHGILGQVAVLCASQDGPPKAPPTVRQFDIVGLKGLPCAS